MPAYPHRVQVSDGEPNSEKGVEAVVRRNQLISQTAGVRWGTKFREMCRSCHASKSSDLTDCRCQMGDQIQRKMWKLSRVKFNLSHRVQVSDREPDSEKGVEAVMHRNN